MNLGSMFFPVAKKNKSTLQLVFLSFHYFSASLDTFPHDVNTPSSRPYISTQFHWGLIVFPTHTFWRPDQIRYIWSAGEKSQS